MDVADLLLTHKKSPQPPEYASATTTGCAFHMRFPKKILLDGLDRIIEFVKECEERF